MAGGWRWPAAPPRMCCCRSWFYSSPARRFSLPARCSSAAGFSRRYPMRVLYLALKDLTQVARDRKSALFLVLMPVLFTVFFGLAFRTADPDPRLPVAVLDADGGALSASLYRLLSASDAVRPYRLEPNDAGNVDGLVRDGKVAAALLVPPQFTQRSLAGETAP